MSHSMNDFFEKGEIILYHGSRGGIDGNILPTSRTRCDFGTGFYMGSNPEQVKGLVVEDSSPVFYTLKIDTKGLSESNVLILEGMDWVYTVLANRAKVSEFNGLTIAKQHKDNCDKYDFIIGSIADDKMNEAMRRFSDNGLTDRGLLACLDSVDYGIQVVAKTDAACKRIHILSSHDIYGKEADDIRDYTLKKRRESRNIVDSMARKYVRDGLYLSEIIDQNSNKVTFQHHRKGR